jgi:putative transposase
MTHTFNVGDRFVLKGAEFEIASANLSVIRVVRCRGGQMFVKTPEEMEEYIEQNNIKIVSAKAEEFRFGVGELPESHKKTLTKRLAYVETVLSNHYTYSSRAANGPQKVIQEVAKTLGEKPPAHSTVCRWIKAFIESQRDIMSLCPPIKRKPKMSMFEDWLEKEISELCDEHYLSDTRDTVIDIAHHIQGKLDEIIIEKGLHGKVKIPSIRTLQRRITETDPMFLLMQELGPNAAKKKLIAAGKSFNVLRVFENVEADGNRMDIIVIDEETGEVIGRPLLTVLIDRCSRHILSYELSFFDFSANTLLSALKKAYNKENDLPGGLIEKLIVDNGSDYISASVKNLLNETGTTIEYAPPYSPNFKPFVERFFRTINTDLFHRLPGTTFSNPKSRGGYDSEANAIVTLGQLKSAIDEFLDVYHNRWHRGLEDTPSNVMRRMLNRRQVGQIPSEQLNNYARITKQCSINKGRVTAFNTKWYSHALRTIEERIKRKGNKMKVDVFIDVLDLGTVLVKNPFDDGYITAVTIRPDLFNNLSLYEYELLRSKSESEGQLMDSLTEAEARKRLWNLTRSFANSDKKKKRRNASKVSEINKRKAESFEVGKHLLEDNNFDPMLTHDVAFNDEPFMGEPSERTNMAVLTLGED